MNSTPRELFPDPERYSFQVLPAVCQYAEGDPATSTLLIGWIGSALPGYGLNGVDVAETSESVTVIVWCGWDYDIGPHKLPGVANSANVRLSRPLGDRAVFDGGEAIREEMILDHGGWIVKGETERDLRKRPH